jgi:hypothetical protein
VISAGLVLRNSHLNAWWEVTKEVDGKRVVVSAAKPAYHGKMGVLLVRGDLNETPPFDRDTRRAARKAAHVSVFFEEAFLQPDLRLRAIQQIHDLSTALPFAKLPVLLRNYVEGIEMQLERKVAYIGWTLANGDPHWLYVPPTRDERYPGATGPQPTSRPISGTQQATSA